MTYHLEKKTVQKTGEHMGLGLATSRVLSQKHGGCLEFSNVTPNGASVTIKLAANKVV